MSLTAPPPVATDADAAAPPRPGRPATRAAARLWARVALAVIALGASGTLRAWQGLRFDAAQRDGRLPPFPLNDLPMTLGPWRGEAESLDPAIARGTGSTDHAFRTYTDARTGVKLGVIVLYGPAAEVFIHAPDKCYPAQGYAMAGPPKVRPIPDGGGGRAPFEAAIYAKGEGGQSRHEEVYHSWYYGDRWTTALPVFKQAERIPGMLKVHVTRLAIEGEYRDDHNPCEEFLAALLPEIRRRLEAAARPAAARAAAPAPSRVAPPAGPV